MAVNNQPYGYNEGQWQLEAPDLFRSPNLTDTALLDPMQSLNQTEALQWSLITGRYGGDAQNIRIVTTRDFLKPATLVPAYGIQMDTQQSVMANITNGSGLGF